MFQTFRSPRAPLSASDNGATELLAAGDAVTSQDRPQESSSDHAWSVQNNDLVGIAGADYATVFSDKTGSQPVVDAVDSSNSGYFPALFGSIWFQVRASRNNEQM
jgi:hypothetical protein